MPTPSTASSRHLPSGTLFSLLHPYGLVIVLLSGATLAAYFAFPSREKLPPGLHADPPVFDAGIRYPQERVTVNVTLTNNYEVPLRLQTVIAGCSCTQPKLAQEQLKPSEHTNLSLEWSLGNKRGKSTEQIYIYYTLPTIHPTALKRLEVLLKAEVIPDIIYEPFELVFIYGQQATKEITLRPGRIKSFSIQQIHVDTPKIITVQYIPERNIIEATYTPNNNSDIGRFLNIYIHTDNSHNPVLRIPYHIVPVSREGDERYMEELSWPG